MDHSTQQPRTHGVEKGPEWLNPSAVSRNYHPPEQSAARLNSIPGEDTSLLEKLPTEILLNVKDHASLVDRAALALASRTLFWKLGPNSTNIKDAKMRTRLLLLLEKDKPDGKNIVCTICGIFHSPLKSTQHLSGSNISRPPCGYRGLYTFGPMSQISPYWLPEEVHFNLVKAIMQSHRLQNQRYIPTMISSNRLYCHPTKEAKIQVSTTGFIFKGKLFLRTVTALFPSREKQRSRQTAPDLLDILRNNRPIDFICSHMSWSGMYPFLLNPFSLRFRPVTYLLHRFGYNVWRTSEPPAFNVHWVDERCLWCYTSCYFKTLDLPDGGGRVVAFISFKDLGCGESTDEVEWKSHVWYRYPFQTKVTGLSTYRAYRFKREEEVPEMFGLDGKGCTLDISCFDKLVEE